MVSLLIYGALNISLSQRFMIMTTWMVWLVIRDRTNFLRSLKLSWIVLVASITSKVPFLLFFIYSYWITLTIIRWVSNRILLLIFLRFLQGNRTFSVEFLLLVCFRKNISFWFFAFQGFFSLNMVIIGGSFLIRWMRMIIVFLSASASFSAFFQLIFQLFDFSLCLFKFSPIVLILKIMVLIKRWFLSHVLVIGLWLFSKLHRLSFLLSWFIARRRSFLLYLNRWRLLLSLLSPQFHHFFMIIRLSSSVYFRNSLLPFFLILSLFVLSHFFPNLFIPLHSFLLLKILSSFHFIFDCLTNQGIRVGTFYVFDIEISEKIFCSWRRCNIRLGVHNMLVSDSWVIPNSLEMFFISGFEMLLSLRDLDQIRRHFSIFECSIWQTSLLIIWIRPIVTWPVQLSHGYCII